MAGFLDPAAVPLLLTGILMVTLAVILLVVDFNNALHRVFGLTLVFQGLGLFNGILRFTQGPQWHVFFTELFPYIQFPLLPLYLLFVSLYPTRRGIGRWRYTPLAIAVVAVALLLLYMLDHSRFATVGPTPEGWIHTAGAGMAYVEYGPLFVVFRSRMPIVGLVALILARDYWKSPHGSAGFTRFLVYVGFALNALFNGTTATFDAVHFLRSGIDFPWWPYGWAQFFMPVLALPLALASLVYIHLASKGEADTPALQEPRRFLYFIAPLPLISGVLIGDPALEAWLSDSIFFILGLWRLSIPLLITYALFRFQAFGADVKIKAGVAKVFLVVVFAIVFFAILEAAESLLGDDLGVGLNVALAAVLALAAAPLQRFASRVADSVMPDTKAVHEQDPYERGEFYRAQYDLVLEDGDVSAKDREMLDRLALSLRISKTQQRQLERGHNTLPRIEGYAEQNQGAEPSGPSRLKRIITALVTAAAFGGIGQAFEGLFPADSFGLSLVSAAAIALLIGPVESLVDRALEPPSDRKARRGRITTYRNAVTAAFVDGNVTAKERQYLDRLQKELGLSHAERIQIHLRVARSVS